jgi:hypothetical protein
MRNDRRLLRARRNRLLLGVLGLACLRCAATAQVTVGRWELIDYDRAHATGKSQIALWLQGDRRVKNPAPANAYNAQGLPLLSIQCVEGRPEFFINLNFEVPSGVVAVASRLDQGADIGGTWNSEGIAIAPDNQVAFVRSLLGKRELSLTLTFPGAEPTSTVFQIAGIDTALQALRPHCSW